MLSLVNTASKEGLRDLSAKIDTLIHSFLQRIRIN